jgi:hypothetical protein
MYWLSQTDIPGHSHSQKSMYNAAEARPAERAQSSIHSKQRVMSNFLRISRPFHTGPGTSVTLATVHLFFAWCQGRHSSVHPEPRPERDTHPWRYSQASPQIIGCPPEPLLRFPADGSIYEARAPATTMTLVIVPEPLWDCEPLYQHQVGQL